MVFGLMVSAIPIDPVSQVVILIWLILFTNLKEVVVEALVIESQVTVWCGASLLDLLVATAASLLFGTAPMVLRLAVRLLLLRFPGGVGVALLVPWPFLATESIILPLDELVELSDSALNDVLVVGNVAGPAWIITGLQLPVLGFLGPDLLH